MQELVELYRDQGKEYRICYHEKNQTLWRVVDEKVSTVVHWILFYAMLFSYYFLQPVYANVRTLLLDLICVIGVLLFVILYTRHAIQHLKIEKYSCFMSEAELYSCLPKIEKRLKIQMILLFVGALSTIISVVLFLQYHNLVFLAGELAGGLIACSIICGSKIPKRIQIIRQLKAHTLPLGTERR